MPAERQETYREEEEAEMVKESQFMKAELRRLKKSLSEKTALETEYEDYQENISETEAAAQDNSLMPCSNGCSRSSEC